MEINAHSIFKIFENNFSFPIVHTILGQAIKMDAYSAYNFSNVTGAGYLDDPTYPFTPKGVMKIFRDAFSYNIVTGIFDRENLYYSPINLQKTRSYLFSGDKYIIPLECMTEKEFTENLENAYSTLLNSKQNPTDYLFFRIEIWKNGNGMECFLEYLACEYFKKKGYIVENQIPLVHTVGSPDFAGYKIKNQAKGFYVTDLSTLRITKNYELLDFLDIDHAIVGEAKTSTTMMTAQLQKYLNTSLFSEGYELHPDKISPGSDAFGLLTISKDYKVICNEPTIKYSKSESSMYSERKYLEWYNNYLKFYMISNLENSELKDLINSKNVKGKYCQQKIVEVISEMDLLEVANLIKEIC